MKLSPYFNFLIRSKDTHIKNSECFMCECESPDHVIVLSYDEEFDVNELKYMSNNESTLWIQTQFHQSYSFLDRVMLCIKYILNPCSTTNQWNTTLIKETDLLKLSDIIDKTLDIYCCKLLYEHKYKNLQFKRLSIMDIDLRQTPQYFNVYNCVTEDGDKLEYGRLFDDIKSELKSSFCTVYIKSINTTYYKTCDVNINYELLQNHCLSMFINSKFKSLKDRHEEFNKLNIMELLEEEMEELNDE